MANANEPLLARMVMRGDLLWFIIYGSLFLVRGGLFATCGGMAHSCNMVGSSMWGPWVVERPWGRAIPSCPHCRLARQYRLFSVRQSGLRHWLFPPKPLWR